MSRPILALPLLLCGLLVLFAPVRAAGQEWPEDETWAASTAEATFLTWAKRHAIALPELDAEADALAPIAPAVGAAKVVALGESAHGAHEPLAFRNQLLRYLVERHGFTAIAIESGITESRRVHDYVNGAEDDEGEVVRTGFTWGFGEYEQNLELVRWLRAHNADPRNLRKVRFYGIDLPGGLGGDMPRARVALDELIAYLDRAAPQQAGTTRAALAPFRDRFTHGQYAKLPPVERQQLRDAIADAAGFLDRKRARLLAARPEENWAWARRNAIAAVRLERFFSLWPTDAPGDRPAPELFDALELRGLTMAEQVQWVLEREGGSGRVLLFAHNGHVMDSPLRGGVWDAFARPPRVMGMHLRATLGDDLRIVAVSSAENGPGLPQIDNVQEFDAVLSRVGLPRYLLDMRDARADPGLLPWLQKQWSMRANFVTEFEIMPSRAFDGVVYFERLTPASRWERSD